MPEYSLEQIEWGPPISNTSRPREDVETVESSWSVWDLPRGAGGAMDQSKNEETDELEITFWKMRRQCVLLHPRGGGAGTEKGGRLIVEEPGS